MVVLVLSGFASSAAPVPIVQPKMSVADTWDALIGEDLKAASCCKTCSKGKACGASCISRDKRCSKGAGCACDG